MFGFVTARNFFGMDINPFAVELAKVTMMIARKLAIDEMHITEPALPLDNLDANFIAGDALVDESGNPEALARGRRDHRQSAVSRRQASEAGARAGLRQTIRRLIPRCLAWRTIASIGSARPTSTLPVYGRGPVTGRAGLVGTQNMRNNQSRVGGLDYMVQDGTIIEAVDNQPWSGEANVHVSIANWVKIARREAPAAGLPPLVQGRSSLPLLDRFSRLRRPP